MRSVNFYFQTLTSLQCIASLVVSHFVSVASVKNVRYKDKSAHSHTRNTSNKRITTKCYILPKQKEELKCENEANDNHHIQLVALWCILTYSVFISATVALTKRQQTFIHSLFYSFTTHDEQYSQRDPSIQSLCAVCCYFVDLLLLAFFCWLPCDMADAKEIELNCAK